MAEPAADRRPCANPIAQETGLALCACATIGTASESTTRGRAGTTAPMLSTSHAISSRASGCFAAIFSKTFAGPVGLLRPCSQFWSVSGLIPRIAANFACDKPSLPRTRARSNSGFR
jgi:hypothetical protein